MVVEWSVGLVLDALEDAAASVRPIVPLSCCTKGGSKMWTAPPTWESSGAT